jgi:hypothetical protein
MTPLLLLSAYVAATPPLVIVGARIEVGDGRIIPVGSILIEDGKISTVGDNFEVPPGTTSIDGKGLTVYPGFIDAYSTSGLKLPATRASATPIPDTRNTAPATMWKPNRRGIRGDVKAAEALDLKGPFNEKYKDGITYGVLSGGDGTLAGSATLISFASEATVVAQEVASEIVFRGGRPGAGMTEMGGGQGRPPATTSEPTYAYPQTLMGITALMRQTLYDATSYAEKTNPKEDVTYEGLRPLVTGKIPALYTLSSGREIARAARFAEEFQFKFIVNGAVDAYRMTETLKKHAAPVILNLDITDEPTRKVADGRDVTPQAVLDDRWNTWKERSQNARILNAAGVPLAVRGSLGTKGYLAGVRKLIEFGLPREAALKAMTSGAASIFGVSDRLGTIESGKIANLVLMSGDFANDKSTVISVVVDGKPIVLGANAPK